MAVDVGSAVGYLDLDINGFLTSLRSAQSEADTASKNIVTKFGANMQSAGKKLTSAGSTLTKSATVPIVGIGTAVIKTSSDFESAMSKVSAISGATGTDLDKLNKKAQEMGAKTKFSATESAEAFTYMAMGGWKTEDMLSGIDGIMNLAAADGLDLATTSDIVTDALTAFGLSAKDSGHFADVLAKASSNANTNVSMLGESFKYAAPVAGSLGYSVEDTAIALGLMANAGIKGSQGGTALRGSLTRLIKPTDDAAALMEQYGLSMTNADGSMKSLGEVMNMLRDKLGGLTEAEQAQVAAQIFGQEAMSGMLAIINASDSDYAKLTSAIYNADGAAQQMADTMLDNLSGQLTLLKSALEGLAIQFGEILMPYIKQFVTWLQNLTQKLQELTPEQKEQIVKWAAVVAAIGPVLVVVGKIITGIGGIISVFSKIPAVISSAKAAFTVVSAALGGISAPVVAVVAVIGVLVAAFVTLWKTNEEFRNNITAVWNGIVSFLTGAWNTIKTTITNALTAIKTTITNVWNAIKTTITNVINSIKTTLTNVWNVIKTTITTIVNAIKTVITNVFNAVKKTITNIWNAIKKTITTVVNGIKSTVSSVLNDVKSTVSSIFTSIKSTAKSVWNGIKSAITTPINAAKSTVSSVVNSIKSTISSGFNAAKSTVSNVFNSIKTSISKVMDSAKTAVSNAINNIKSKFNFSWSLPKLKMPHPKISGKFSLNPPSVPHFSIEWYKKAMNNAMILNDATIFGAKGGNLLGGGEAGPEVVSGVGTLMKMIREAVASVFVNMTKMIQTYFDEILLNIRQSNMTLVESIAKLVDISSQFIQASEQLGYVTYNGFSKVREVIEKPNDKPGTRSGDTFIFNSPKAIDEIEAARQMKKTKQDMAEGF